MPSAFYFIVNVRIRIIDSIPNCKIPCIDNILDSITISEEKIETFNDTLLFYYESSSSHTYTAINRKLFQKSIEAMTSSFQKSHTQAKYAKFSTC